MALVYHLRYRCQKYRITLQGGSIPGTTFYPDPDDRALTVNHITRSAVGRAAVVQVLGSETAFVF